MNDRLTTDAFLEYKLKLDYFFLDMILVDSNCGKMETKASFMGIFSMTFKISLLCTNNSSS